MGPAAVGLPVTWAGEALAHAAQRWFRRLGHADDLSRLVKAATGSCVDLSRPEFNAVRQLLEDQQTWSIAGRGTIEDLAALIGNCLPSRDGRTAEDSHAAAMTIARGLLEFAVSDLDPKLFQRLLLARLQRMEIGQASALDEALIGLHADLTARLAAQGGLDEHRFTAMMTQLKRVLDLLPPGPAQRGEIVAYLRTMIDWLNTDPWPRDRRFSGPALTPAAVERKLRVASPDQARWQVLDADELANQCRRLVILGSPGSGKTWLAKRMARRCAEEALTALAAGQTLDEVELPLFTTCSHLFGAAGSSRQAAISAALDHIADLGGSRITDALRLFFSERNAPTLLVLDSLDEAPGNDERLRQADWLPWRIAVTTRASSWNHQLNIEKDNDSHKVGVLLPLRYPDDVETFIHAWFKEQPERGKDLAAQIARRPDLRRSATVPLLLAFYCVIGGKTPLPEFRRDIYAQVLRRLLTGRWRGNSDHQLDPDTCMRTLRAWAWSGAASDPISGVGTWVDDILTGSSPQSALDHVAVPLGPPNVDTGMVRRRFIHRSIREHLVAEHIAALPVEDAAQALLPHLWYDPDWEYAAPTAIAMHPEHDRLLRELACRVRGTRRMTEDSAISDGDQEWEKLLVRVSAESDEADWSPQVAATISRAQIKSVAAVDIGVGGKIWCGRTSRHQLCQQLLPLLERQHQEAAVARLVSWIIHLSVTPDNQREASRPLIMQLAGARNPAVAKLLVDGVVQLASTPGAKRRTRHALITLLAARDFDWGVRDQLNTCDWFSTKEWLHFAIKSPSAAEISPSPVAKERDSKVAVPVIDGLVRLAATAEDKRQTRDVLLLMLVRQAAVRPKSISAIIGEDRTNTWLIAPLSDGVVRLAPTAEDKRQVRDALLPMLFRRTDQTSVAALTNALVRLHLAEEDHRDVRNALLAMLAGQTNGAVAVTLIETLIQLDPKQADKRNVRTFVLATLATLRRQESEGGLSERGVPAALIKTLIQLDPTQGDKDEARQALLKLVAEEPASSDATELLGLAMKLGATENDKHRMCQALLTLLASNTNAWEISGLANFITILDPSEEEKRQVRQALLAMLVTQTRGSRPAYLAKQLAQLDPTEEEKRQVLDVLLSVLAGRASDPAADEGMCYFSSDVAEAVIQFNPEPKDRHQALGSLLLLLTRPGASSYAASRHLMEQIVQLAVEPVYKRTASEALLAILSCQDRQMHIVYIARGLAELATSVEAASKTRKALLALLPAQTHMWTSRELAAAVLKLRPGEREKGQVRTALLAQLTHETDASAAQRLFRSLTQAGCTVRDLKDTQSWAAPPTTDLLAEVRRNSALADWLAFLSSLATPAA